MISYDGIPEHCVDGLRNYLEHGIEPGGFLMAVLTNNLVEAFGRADEINRVALEAYASWLYNECPRNAWGSVEKVDTWIDHIRKRA